MEDRRVNERQKKNTKKETNLNFTTFIHSPYDMICVPIICFFLLLLFCPSLLYLFTSSLNSYADG